MVEGDWRIFIGEVNAFGGGEEKKKEIEYFLVFYILSKM